MSFSRSLFFLFACLLTTAVFAQSAQTSLHLDRPYHVAGEVSWFAAYAPAPVPPKMRCTVYAPSGAALDYFFLETDAMGQTTGYYRWPFELATGYYRLALEALTESGEVASLGVFEHPVYAEQRVEASAGADAGAKQDKLPAANGLSATVSNGNLQLSGLQGDAYSLSIVNAEVVGQETSALGMAAATTANWRDTLFFPLTIKDKAGAAYVTNLLPVFDPATFTFGYTRTDAAGAGVIELGPFSGAKTVQPRSVEKLDILPMLSDSRLPVLNRTPPVTATVANYIDLSRRRRKIYQLFATVETEVNGSLLPQERALVEPNRDFQVQDYKVFSDMFNFFKEVGGELRVRVKKDNYRAQLYNAPSQRFFQDSPLYIVDGKLTNDNNYVNKMSPSGVSYLAYYYVRKYLRKRFSILGGNGVVQVETLRAPENFPAADAEDILTVNGLQPASSFLPRDAATDAVPALSPLLLWQTGGGTSAATIKLPETDDYGNYRITVIARGPDKAVRAVTTDFKVAAR